MALRVIKTTGRSFLFADGFQGGEHLVVLIQIELVALPGVQCDYLGIQRLSSREPRLWHRGAAEKRLPGDRRRRFWGSKTISENAIRSVIGRRRAMVGPIKSIFTE